MPKQADPEVIQKPDPLANDSGSLDASGKGFDSSTNALAGQMPSAIKEAISPDLPKEVSNEDAAPVAEAHDMENQEVKNDDIQIDIAQSAVEVQEPVEPEAAPSLTQKAPFCSVFVDVLLFHHRLINCHVRHRQQSHRPVQVLSFVA